MSKAMEAASRTQCVLVLGMHRSGTSAATRCLNMLGMDLGSHLLMPDDVNSKGYWEHADAVRINDELLGAFGLAWWSLTPLPEDWLDSEAAHSARRQIEHVVRRDFSAVPLWGLKDPRLCRTAPLWIEVLTKMGIAVSAMFVARAPGEVASSLEKAQGLSKGAGVLLWMQHLAESERATRGLPRAMITYDQLLAEPLAALERVGRSLGVAWPIAPEQRIEALGAFLDTGMRNHRRQPEESGELPTLAREMDQASRSMVGDDQVAWQALSRLSDQVTDWLKLLEYRALAPLPDEVIAANSRAELEAQRELATLYWATGDQSFAQDRSISMVVPSGRSELEFPVPVLQGARYRLDPLIRRGQAILHRLKLTDGQRQVVWDWADDPEQVSLVGIHTIDRPSTPGSALHVMGDDPQLAFSWPEGMVEAGFVLCLDIERLDVAEMAKEFAAFDVAMREREEQFRDRLTQRQAEIEALHVERNTVLTGLNQQLITISKREARMQSQLASQFSAIETLRQGQLHQDEVMRTLLRRGLWASLHRRLARTEFRMLPKQHLEVVDVVARRYRVTGDDPIFVCDSENYPLAPGWYRVTLHMEQYAGIPAQACFYPDYGPDVPSDPAGVGMPFVRSGRSIHHGLVRFSHPVKGLRFDPATAPCDISVSRLLIQRVSKPRAGWELYKAWRRPLETLGKPRPAWRSIVKNFREHGLSGGIGELYRWYTTADARAPLYDAWVDSFDHMSTGAFEAARARAGTWSYRPLISILVPTYNTDEKWLRRCVDSVLGAGLYALGIVRGGRCLAPART